MPNYVVYLTTVIDGFCIVHTERFLQDRKYFQVPDTLSETETLLEIDKIRNEAERDGCFLDSIPALADYMNSHARNNGFGKIVVRTGSLEERVKKRGK